MFLLFFFFVGLCSSCVSLYCVAQLESQYNVIVIFLKKVQVCMIEQKTHGYSANVAAMAYCCHTNLFGVATALLLSPRCVELCHIVLLSCVEQEWRPWWIRSERTEAWTTWTSL